MRGITQYSCFSVAPICSVICFVKKLRVILNLVFLLLHATWYLVLASLNLALCQQISHRDFSSEDFTVEK